MKKIIALILSVIFLAVACGDIPDDNSSQVASDTSSGSSSSAEQGSETGSEGSNDVSSDISSGTSSDTSSDISDTSSDFSDESSDESSDTSSDETSDTSSGGSSVGGSLDIPEKPVEPTYAESVSFAKDTFYVPLHTMVGVDVNVYPADATQKDYILTSSDESILAVMLGSVMGLNEGEVTLTVHLATDSEIYDVCKVIVKADASVQDPEDDKPSHTCKLVKNKVVEPTCTNYGYTLYVCSCGKKEDRDHKSPLGHDCDYENGKVVQEPTTTSTGIISYVCRRCKFEVFDKLPALPSETDKYNAPATAANAKLIEERVLYYINKYRNEEGVSSAQFLWDGKTYKYAKMRAEQIVDNFEHDREDIIEVCNELKFGSYQLNWTDGTGSGTLVEPYYYGGCSEAITGPYNGSTVDYVANYVAVMIRSSSGHWNYVGAETTKYISVGGYFDIDCWYFCIATTDSTKFD